MAHGRHSHHRHNYHDHNPQPPTPPETPVPPEPPATPDFAQLGAVFNDATRALVGGLWQNVVEEGGQGLGSVFRYVSDLQTVQQGLQARIDAGQFSGVTLANVQQILSDITTATAAATASVNGGGAFGSVKAAEQALHDSHVDVLAIVNGDPNLASLATQDGASGFLAPPPTLPDGVTAETAPHANLAEIGVIFNDAANRILGGVNADNKDVITNDIAAVITHMKDLMANNQLLFGGLSGVHAEAVVRQLELEFEYIDQAGINPDAGRASNDNILDIIDIIQGDTNLANMANQNGVSGFTPFPDSLNPTPRYQDNEAQTNFWANFIAQSNSLGQQAIALVDSGDDDATAALIGDLHAFQKTVTDFDAAQGGIFEARFDNELLGETSTLGAEVTKMIEGLQTKNAALVGAAAEQMHANSADVGGNNIPITGGAYNPDGLTVAEVLSTANVEEAVASASAEPPVAAVSSANGSEGEKPAGPGVASATSAASAVSGAEAAEAAEDASPLAGAQHQFHHWHHHHVPTNSIINDILRGGEGFDTSVFHRASGNHAIDDFSEHDLVDFSHGAAGTAHNRNLDFTQTDSGVVLTLADGATITFDGLSLDDLDHHDFHWSA